MEFLCIIDTSKTEFNNTIDKIASRPEYKNLANSIMDFVDMIKEKITRFILNILMKTFSNAASALSISKGASTVILIIGLLALLALITFIAVKIGKAFERRRRITEILGEKIDDNTTPFTLKEKAALSLAAGEIREAIRYDFIALLLLMHENNLIYLDETKTNEEIYYFLKRNGFNLLSNFRYCIDTFNLVWYGHKIEGGSVYEKWDGSLSQLWNGVISDETKSK